MIGYMGPIKKFADIYYQFLIENYNFGINIFRYLNYNRFPNSTRIEINILLKQTL